MTADATIAFLRRLTRRQWDRPPLVTRPARHYPRRSKRKGDAARRLKFVNVGREKGSR